MSSVFNVEKLVKSYNGIEVLKEISLSVNKGEVVAIIGPSGSGKTTFLRCATLLEEMDSGKLSFGDITAVDKLQNVNKISSENIISPLYSGCQAVPGNTLIQIKSEPLCDSLQIMNCIARG